MNEKLSSRIDEITKELKLARRQLELRSGISIGSISKWTSGKFAPNAASLKKLADFCNVSTAYLTGESDFKTDSDAMVDGAAISQLDAMMFQNIRGALQIPVYDLTGAEVGHEIIDYHLCQKSPDDCFAVVSPDHLVSVGSLCEILIVRKQEEIESGKIVLLEDTIMKTLLVRRITLTTHGLILEGLTPDILPTYFQELPPNLKVSGRVIEIRKQV